VRGIKSFVGVVLVVVAAVAVWTRRAVRWGATPAEISATGTGEDWFEGVPGSRRRMTRAISIDAPQEIVWGWLAQVGRGAGWYSYTEPTSACRAARTASDAGSGARPRTGQSPDRADVG
jgi:hypothetical protein